ncbi:hypothetical protein BKA67DRAFT_538815 [Truncatella angustata]|uniref:Uncharacterized protein n=1 Tax=Truncatella angustata TaxID=152316 RepID=A0A9P8ZVB8_9PEZI|nr:uncharacterized protein BKA67DRAFT_538815 [Truncatella angustata]KAH6648803.1 hypothetical protein BKA67DRAFT_538815 [Truncatella angustata]KAH8200867.1 hypothetical protein TruAng_004953 [Truncatella angustata]
MAANETLTASLSFMTDAAHLLAQVAPETSAHLMSQRNALMFHNNLEQSETQRQHVCGSCGHIMIPGRGSLIKLEGEKASRKHNNRKGAKKQPRPSETTKHKVLTCGNCGQYTNISFLSPPSVSRSRNKLKQNARRLRSRNQAGPPSPAVRPPPLISAPEPAKASVNANSKKRAKNRKQGLQALLQQSQASTTKSGLGLSLTDFMKK